jgi:hypothetical protein
MYLQFVKLYNNTKRYCMNTWPAYLHVCVHTYIHTYNIAYVLNKDVDVERCRKKMKHILLCLCC